MKTVIELAQSVGAARYTNRHYPDRPVYTFSIDQLERLVELVRADERNSWPAEMEAMERQVNILTDALAKQPAQQEPVGCLKSDPDEGHVFVPRIEGDWSMLGKDLYTTPQAQPAREPLTDEQSAKAWSVADGEHNASASVKRRITRAIEAARNIKENQS